MSLSEIHQQWLVVFPMHPRTRQRIENFGLRHLTQNMMVIEPVGYLDMVMLEKNARLIATDSSGIQKEAYFYRVPCVTLRQETEWVELVEIGWNRLATTGSQIKKAIDLISSSNLNYLPNLYGDGDASHKIATLLVR